MAVAEASFRVVASDDYVGLGAQRAVARGDDHAGDASAQRLVEIGHVRLHDRTHVGLGDRAGQVAAGHRAVAHAHYLDRADGGGLLGHLHVDDGPPADRLLDGGVAQIGEGEGLRLGGLNGVAAVRVGRGALRRAFYQDRHADQRIARRVDDAARDRRLRKTLCGQQQGGQQQSQSL